MSTVMVVVLVEGLSTSSTSSNTKKSTTIIYSSTDIPPLVDVPVWSMATLNNDASNENTTRTTTRTTNMNIITYVTPISIRPNRLYAVGLFKKTLSRENFLREKTCILQLLCDDEEQNHISCVVKVLGGQSGYDIQKQNVLQESFNNNDHGSIDELQDLTSSVSSSEEILPKVLPGCVQYLKLSLVGNEIIEYDNANEDGEEESSSHDIVICKVDEMWTTTSTSTSSSSVDDEEEVVELEGAPKKQQQKQQKYLSTGRLRELGIITEQGRIAITATAE
ncbi:hypothetical protein FRACYDRAFT_238316 [Fragilariopsis cylindrus CCMP1102]|uniref:Uncharacterized protein n=1 Tax=Fragilariopsis cylindrus CCMP1102 TaxID=635003 RepID=A0A1E7FIC2_9STRA|nr:hypothetical protein FRACYDRAFT_238316 [Fragilariopsis cylindrus CCMP1102]|eukprot:OEU17887.1 hypothetical protein FRACYDRAFT_238316 [Fragilariopsis cylindrus CCMP1102]